MRLLTWLPILALPLVLGPGLAQAHDGDHDRDDHQHQHHHHHTPTVAPTLTVVPPTVAPSKTATKTPLPTATRTATRSATPTATVAPPTATATHTATATATASRTPTASATSPSGPSGQPLPIGDLPGWHQVFTDDFTQAVPLGQFPDAVSSRWFAYPLGWHDTSGNGSYDPHQGLSVHDGLLDIFVHTTSSGEIVVEAPVPKLPNPSGSEGGQLYGRYAVRFKADPVPGYKTAWLLWPDSENWPTDGEIDFPEGDLTGTISAFMHRQNGADGSDQDAYDTSVPEAGAWHTAVTEWTANSLTFILDGQVIGQSTSRIPNTPMHWVLQTETSLNNSTPPSAAGHVLVDWVAIYSPV